MENTLVNVVPSNPVYKWELERSLGFVERAIDELKQDTTFLAQNNLTVEDLESVKRMLKTEGLPLLVTGTDAYFIHYSTFPLLRERVEDKLLEQVRQGFDKYMRQDDFKRVHSITMLDRDLSNLYRYNLLVEVLREVLKRFGQNKAQGQGRGDAFKGAVRMALNNPNVVGKACQNASKRTREVEDVAPLVGKEPGRFERLLRIQRRRVVNLKRIVALARRISMDVKARRTLTPSPMGHVEGYRRTQKLERAIARELALPEELFLAKLAGNGFTAWDKRVQRLGAYYVVIDKSGSMFGVKTEWARAVALAILDKAKYEGAGYYLRFFDTEVYPDRPARNPSEVAELIATIGSDGGTSIDTALSTALEDLKSGRYDTESIILITDGEDWVNTPPEAFKAIGARLIAVMIQGENESLREIARATGGEYLKAELTREGALKLISLLET